MHFNRNQLDQPLDHVQDASEIL